MKIHVEEDKCVGAGQCVLAAPEVFDQRDDGIVVLLDVDPPAAELGHIELAVRVCPARALALPEA